MNARTAILDRLKTASARPIRSVQPYRPSVPADLAQQFIARTLAADATASEIASVEDAPVAIAALYAAQTQPVAIHVPDGSPLEQLPWQRAGNWSVTCAAPGANAIALSMANYAIAETGTLVFLSGNASPSSWHFLPGVEVALLRKSTILPILEDVFETLARGRIPATLNLITGPSRTADIEQTIERGAHGPRALHVLIIRD
jgi:L-lactate dehydrogenase complex protein LldG